MTVNKPTFKKIENNQELVAILRQRLPKSANIFNAAVKHHRFTEELNFYSPSVPLTDKSWIISIYYKEDYGNDISISGPIGEQPNEEFKEAFINSAPFPWDQPYIFTAIDRNYSEFVYNTSIVIKGNCSNVHPSALYYMNTEDTFKINTNYVSKNGFNVEVRELKENVEEGLNFFMKTWKFCKKGSEINIRRVVERNESSGVFVNGQLVAANNLAGTGVGLMCQFYTLPEFRKEGLGSICTKFLMKKIGESGCVPVCGAEEHNSRSRKFMESIGLKFLLTVDYIFFPGSNYE